MQPEPTLSRSQSSRHQASPGALRHPKKRRSFLSAFPSTCLSRACLGKIMFRYTKWSDKNTACFLTRPRARSRGSETSLVCRRGRSVQAGPARPAPTRSRRTRSQRRCAQRQSWRQSSCRCLRTPSARADAQHTHPAEPHCREIHSRCFMFGCVPSLSWQIDR